MQCQKWIPFPHPVARLCSASEAILAENSALSHCPALGPGQCLKILISHDLRDSDSRTAYASTFLLFSLIPLYFVILREGNLLVEAGTAIVDVGECEIDAEVGEHFKSPRGRTAWILHGGSLLVENFMGSVSALGLLLGG